MDTADNCGHGTALSGAPQLSHELIGIFSPVTLKIQ
jgi:hypothetical protein